MEITITILWVMFFISLGCIGYFLGRGCNTTEPSPIKEPISLEERVDQNAEDILGLKEHIIDLYHVECKKLRRELEFEEVK